MSDEEVTQSDMVSIDRRALLRFFDEVPDDSCGHATAVVAIAGEELGLALLLDYFLKTGTPAKKLEGPCSQGRKRGHRLDAWVERGSTLYQVEVKSWSAHSFGGTPLRADISPEELANFRMDRWNEVWVKGTLADASATKVLERMHSPRRGANVEPLIVFWVAMNPTGEPDPFFSEPIEGGRFPRINVFSISGYLRTLTEDTLVLKLPNTRARLRWLSEMFDIDEVPGGSL